MLGDGRQWRPFVHVADVCQAMLLLLRVDPGTVSGELFNLGGDHLNHTVKNLADFAKIRERLGFVPSRPVADGAREKARRDRDAGTPVPRLRAGQGR